MRCAVFGDVHGNYDALEVVLGDIEAQHPDVTYCTGDLVGYGAEPSQCVKAVRRLGCPVVAGNHDYAVVGRTDLSYFNPEAQWSVLWTRSNLTGPDFHFLRAMELSLELEGGLLVHGSPAEPEAFGYILSVAEALRAFESMAPGICFVGHSHVPVTFWYSGAVQYDAAPRIELKGAEKAILNVGSVGQPRDGDPRAGYAIYDSESRVVEMRRLEYDWDAAAEKIIRAGLPEINAHRLKIGQ